MRAALTSAAIILPMLATGVAATPSVVATASSANGRSVVPGTVPPWAKAENFQASANPNDPVGFRIYLGWHNEGALSSLIQSVSDPTSQSYGQFLTPAAFRAEFAPSAADAASVASWLTSQGFSVNYTPANNHYVSAEGSVSQAVSAFGVEFGTYKVNGQALRAPTSDITLPSSIAPMVSGEIGLDESAALVQTPHIVADPDAGPSAGFTNAPPCSAYWGEKNDLTNPTPAVVSPAGYPTPMNWAPCGYTPSQVKGAYVGPTTLDGTSQTVGIIDAYASPTILQDANQWSANRGVPLFGTAGGGTLTQVVAPGTYNRPDNKKQSPTGWYGEETLDVEAVHGMAPNANIVYVGAPNNYQDLDAAMNHFVDQHLGQIVSNSYGFNTEALPRGFIIPFEQTLMQGAAEGIGIYFSSGDNSDESTVDGYISADWPASSPYVTAVGGTSAAFGQGNSYLFETGWGTKRSRWLSPSATCSTAWCPAPPNGRWLYGAGGGVSCLFAPPTYQQSAGISRTAPAGSLCPGFNGRAVPDIGAIADPNTGYLIGQTQSFPSGTHYAEYRIGGTSLASPIFAGLMALADQHLGSPHGFANAAIYQNGSSFRDIQDPASPQAVLRNDFKNGLYGPMYTSMRTFNDTLSLHTTKGWDDVTGFGTPSSALLSLP